MRPIQSEDGETREFVIIPPAGAVFDALSKQREIEEELNRRFPDMKFTVTTEGPAREERGFGIIPVLGAADSGQPMLEWPSFDVLEEVVGCLAEFIVRSETKPQLH